MTDLEARVVSLEARVKALEEVVAGLRQYNGPVGPARVYPSSLDLRIEQPWPFQTRKQEDTR